MFKLQLKKAEKNNCHGGIKMTDLNSISLGGRITKDAIVEKAKDGLSIVKISMAVNRSKKKRDSDEYEDKPVFVDLAPIYGNYAESMVKYFTKGTYITVEGYLDMDSWTSDDGQRHQRLKIVPEQGKINPWVERKARNLNEEKVSRADDSTEETVNDIF